MRSNDLPIQHLVSLPPAAVPLFRAAYGAGGARSEWFAASDPVLDTPDGYPGSGAGTAHLLAEAWRAARAEQGGLGFLEWLRLGPKLVIHGGGQSRRLPAYAALGKPLIPLPVFRWAWGQRLDQTLLDLQAPVYRGLLQQAAAAFDCAGAADPAGRPALLVASGDVLLQQTEPGARLPEAPAADVVVVGREADAETARNFGVLFSARGDGAKALAFSLQKPAPEEIEALAPRYRFLLDTGAWILSERAVLALMERCGWDAEREEFAGGRPAPYEFYGGFGQAVGEQARARDSELNALSAAVLPAEGLEFHHFGTSRQLIEVVAALQNVTLRQTGASGALLASARAHSDQITQNTQFDPPIRRAVNKTLWVENAAVPAGWRLAFDHVLTGVPDNDWELALEPGVCLDFAPMDDANCCLRVYGMDDTFKGALGDSATLWLGRPAAEWLAARGLTWDEAGLSPEQDIQLAPLFPVGPVEAFDGPFIEWLFRATLEGIAGAAREELRKQWLAMPRLSAQEAAKRANLTRLATQREQYRARSLAALYAHRQDSVFYRLDLDATARLCAASSAARREVAALAVTDAEAETPLQRVSEHMWRAALARHGAAPGGGEAEAREAQAAFRALREAVLRDTRARRAEARMDALEDQIVWARSPVRMDLAGGWTDTPPYCLLHGGCVTNVAVNLNGQPPVQVFAKRTKRPEIVIRSIDLGVEERVTGYDEIERYAEPGSEFALAKAALAQAGFLPRFYEPDGDKGASSGFRTLAEQLEALGGGIELSLLAAVPQGSGLGTSSILGATLLGALNDLCALGWNRDEVLDRTLGLEQMMTTGGGWQDQAGGILPGIKTVETQPGIPQRLTARWLPDRLFTDERARLSILLYYTGVTRLAKNILQEIVRGMFLNAADRLGILAEIGDNARAAADAIQRADWHATCEAVARAWDLNQRLDAGTNPPAVQAILDPVSDWLDAAKLPGAGGGGYVLMFAKDEEAARRVVRALTDNPPNARARFVGFAVSQTGMEITRS